MFFGFYVDLLTDWMLNRVQFLWPVMPLVSLHHFSSSLIACLWCCNCSYKISLSSCCQFHASLPVLRVTSLLACYSSSHSLRTDSWYNFIQLNWCKSYTSSLKCSSDSTALYYWRRSLKYVCFSAESVTSGFKIGVVVLCFFEWFWFN